MANIFEGICVLLTIFSSVEAFIKVCNLKLCDATATLSFCLVSVSYQQEGKKFFRWVYRRSVDLGSIPRVPP